ncbi:MAG: hypothetical protein NTZ10_01405 [Candidatus Saganbacteria bacterium]|nr:hypothetical protein [Candidatus Saganbacteria bacterium]
MTSLKFVGQTYSGAQVRAVKLPAERDFRHPAFEYRKDELGGRFTSIINRERVGRPAPSQRVGQLGFDQSLAIIRSNPGATGFEQRLTVAKLTTSPIVLHMILTSETEPLITAAAAANPNAPLQKELRAKGCHFCDFKKWGEPREIPDGFKVGWASNPFPFAPSHEVHISTDPIHNLSEMTNEPAIAIDFIRLAFLRARQISLDLASNTQNVLWGINYGTGRVKNGEQTTSAFATLQHFHSQMMSDPIGAFEPNVNAIEAYLKGYDGDFYADYTALLAEKRLTIKSYEGDVHLVAPWAQMSKHHMRIIAPVSNFHGAKPSDDVVRGMGIAFFDAIRILNAFEVRTFNCLSHPSPVTDPKRRLVIDVIPRGGLAMRELASAYVVDEFPEATAEKAMNVLAILGKKP